MSILTDVITDRYTIDFEPNGVNEALVAEAVGHIDIDGCNYRPL